MTITTNYFPNSVATYFRAGCFGNKFTKYVNILRLVSILLLVTMSSSFASVPIEEHLLWIKEYPNGNWGIVRGRLKVIGDMEFLRLVGRGERVDEIKLHDSLALLIGGSLGMAIAIPFIPKGYNNSRDAISDLVIGFLLGAFTMGVLTARNHLIGRDEAQKLIEKYNQEMMDKQKSSIQFVPTSVISNFG